MLATTIPSELKCHIATFCAPAALANLALVHNSFQKESEAILYKQLNICLVSKNTKSRQIWTTLKLHTRKANLVHSLTIWLLPSWESPNHDIRTAYIELFCGALANMHALRELRLYFSHKDMNWQMKIMAVLRKVPFNLNSLHCSQFFDLSAITDAHSNSLQTLGVFSNGGDDSFLSTIQNISVKHPDLTLFSYEQEGAFTMFKILHIYPALSLGSGFSWKPISDCYSRNSNPHMGLETESVISVRIYLSDISDTQSLRRLVEEMIGLFPNVRGLELLFRDTPPELNVKDLSTIISPIPCLQELSFRHWFSSTQYCGQSITNSDRFALARTWEATCSNLQSIEFLDGSWVQRSVDDNLDWH
ncbi:MAG: hypothetical protein NXY57DRAFT_1021581 [Lentinula lateritia]|uniref:F-box domain-containing protein n=1 Tax=Lentinula lateritia TaxID=40482 RepID=A0ABQ8V2Q8_9AGAR|nr:MAG: hypothetical protein NXY57DRAFT_1021581 [Lentinula lateritia]KAJ4471184.1 hypothetical protein C8R41DRAFT_984190 [Lentinula lateritia]